MKKILIVFLLAFVFISCAKEQKSDSAPSGKPVSSIVLEDSLAQVSGYTVTLVELGSTTCVPCKMMKEVLAEVEKKYAGEVNIVFHDIKAAAGKPFGKLYKVRIIPTQVFLDSSGFEFYRHEGFYALADIEEILKEKGVAIK